MNLEFLQTRHDNLGEVTLLEAVGNLDGFIQLAFAQSAGDGRSELTALLARRVKCHQPVNHDANGPRRHKEHDGDHELGRQAHLIKKVPKIPPRRSRFLQQHERPHLHL